MALCHSATMSVERGPTLIFVATFSRMTPSAAAAAGEVAKRYHPFR